MSEIKRTLRILMIEDVEADYLIISRHIRKSGLEADLHWAKDKAELTAALTQGQWDLVLSDYKVAGLDFLETLRHLQLQLPDVPVILVSGSVGEELAVDLLKQGLNDFVLKDRLSRLVPAIERSLNEREQQRRREEAELQLARNERLMRSVLDGTSDAVFVKDLRGRYLLCNRAAAGFIGMAVDEILGCDDRALFPPDTAARIMAFDRQILTEGQVFTREEVLTTRSGGQMTFLVTKGPVIDENGQVSGIFGISRDITGQRKLEEQIRQAQKMESIGTLAGGIAHDFNNILSSILGYGELALEEMAADSPGWENVNTILEAGRRASHLTRDLLLFSRKQVSQKQQIEVNAVIARIEKFIRRIIGEDIRCETVLAGEPLQIYADGHQIEQVLMNFASNARDAMPQGGCLSITTERIVIDQAFIERNAFGSVGSYALITVADTGRGMDRETAEKIFEPFFTTKEMGKGTGLGLAVVYGIVMNHQGFIDVSSEPGKGCRFRIYLPVSEAEKPAAVSGGEQEIPKGGSETILVAEDEVAVRRLITTILGRNGYTVIEAVNGEEAVQQFSAHRDEIDMLLFDLMMPVMDGKQACDAIRSIKGDVRGIFVSGYAPDNIRPPEYLDLPMEILFKPFSPKELLRTVRRILDTP